MKLTDDDDDVDDFNEKKHQFREWTLNIENIRANENVKDLESMKD